MFVFCFASSVGVTVSLQAYERGKGNSNVPAVENQGLVFAEACVSLASRWLYIYCVYRTQT